MLEGVDRQTEQEVLESIDPEALDEHIEALEGLTRVSGNAGESVAAEYVTNTLESYGVETECYEYEGYVSEPHTASLELTVPSRTEYDRCLTVAFSASTPPAGTHGEIVAVPELDSRRQTDRRLEDAILFVPDLPKPTIANFAQSVGASAVICQSPNDHLYEGSVTSVWGTPSIETRDQIPDIPVVQVSQTIGDELLTLLESGPVEGTVHASVTTELRTLPCPVGKIEGTESDRYFVIGNHIDSWHEGVTDNATAVAATLEIARIFSERQPKRGLLFGFWSAHSTGRYAGSAWYADEHWLDLRENGVAYLHIDLPGLKGATEIWYQHMAELEGEHLDAIAVATNMDRQEGNESYLGETGRPARNSDQSFWGTGLSSLLSGARLEPETEDGGPIGGGWWWHTPEDTRDKVDLDVLVEETKLYLTLTSRLCESPVLPHDYTAAIDDIEGRLESIEDEIGAEFGETKERIATLRTTIDEANAVIEARGATTKRVQTDLEDFQVRLGNILIPAQYMGRQPYEQEPSLPYDRLPAFDPNGPPHESTDNYQRFAHLSSRRARTRLQDHIQRAQTVASAFVDEHASE